MMTFPMERFTVADYNAVGKETVHRTVHRNLVAYANSIESNCILNLGQNSTKKKFAIFHDITLWFLS